MTFGLLYAFTENFVLPLSHDEVVHGKGSLLARMPGDDWQQFAKLRAYYAFMWAHPGKKLLFMGQEFAQGREWNFDAGLDWQLLDVGWHRGVQTLRARLQPRLPRRSARCTSATARATASAGSWSTTASNSVFAWLRLGGDGAPPVAVVSNFTPVPRDGYRIGLPLPGRWREILNTDAAVYGGSGRGNVGGVDARDGAEPRLPVLARDSRCRRSARSGSSTTEARDATHARPRDGPPGDERNGPGDLLDPARRARRWPTCWPAGAAAG